jgi:hypothetical protein
LSIRAVAAASPVTAELSVVVVTASRFAPLRRTVRHLRAQTIRQRIELVIVARDEEALSDLRESDTAGFQAVRKVCVGPIDNAYQTASEGIRLAAAPIVGLVEDHAYPEPEWAEAVLRAHGGPWTAVGSAHVNANPESTLSWVNFLISYWRWAEPIDSGETRVSRNNIALKAEALVSYGDNLRTLLGREGRLLDDLESKGARFYLEREARMHHLNPSSIRATAQLRYHAGRLYAARRAKSEAWPLLKRLVYSAGAPLIPFVRFYRLHRDWFDGGKRADLRPRIYPALAFALSADAVGQFAGFLLGPGDASRKCARLDVDRVRLLRRPERQRFARDDV